jgi:hypothetical protein
MSKKVMEFDGKNFNDIKTFLSAAGVQSTQGPNKQVTVFITMILHIPGSSSMGWRGMDRS